MPGFFCFNFFLFMSASAIARRFSTILQTVISHHVSNAQVVIIEYLPTPRKLRRTMQLKAAPPFNGFLITPK